MSDDQSYYSNGNNAFPATSGNLIYPTQAEYQAANQAVSEQEGRDAATYTAPLTSHEPMQTGNIGEEEEEEEFVDGKEAKDDALEYTKRNEFTSEVFKMEVRGLPKFFPPGQLKKLLSETMQLEVKKIKPTGPGKEHCYITFADQTAVQKAIVMLDGYKWKGKTLSTNVSAPAFDPLVKILQKKTSEGTYKTTNEEDDKLPIAERVAKMVTPYAHMSYEEQLKTKQEAAHSVLKKIGREIAKLNPALDDFVRWHKLRRKGAVCEMDPIVASPVVDGYRNKCEFTIGINSDTEEQTVGFRVASYKEGNVSVGPVDDLKHINDTMKTVVKAFEKLVRESQYNPFDPVTHKGVFRQLAIRTTNGGDCLIVVSVHPQQLDTYMLASLKQELVQFCEGDGPVSGIITSLYCVTFGQRESGVDEEFEHLWGESHITETVLGKKFRISPQAFFQVNTPAAEKLYEKVGELIDVDCTNVLVDVCCGTGTIGITLAETAHRMYGLEIVEQAVEDARHNAALNNLGNTDFLAGNCEQTLPAIFSSFKGLEVKAIMDPPRAGLPASVISTIRKQEAVSTLVYMACDPNKVHLNFQSLARPVSKQVKGQYFIPVRAVAVDLFPHTDKYELVIQWERWDDTKWRRIMEGNPRPRDVAYYKRVPELPEREAFVKEWAEKKAARDGKKAPASGSGGRSASKTSYSKNWGQRTSNKQYDDKYYKDDYNYDRGDRDCYYEEDNADYDHYQGWRNRQRVGGGGGGSSSSFGKRGLGSIGDRFGGDSVMEKRPRIVGQGLMGDMPDRKTGGIFGGASGTFGTGSNFFGANSLFGVQVGHGVSGAYDRSGDSLFGIGSSCGPFGGTIGKSKTARAAKEGSQGMMPYGREGGGGGGYGVRSRLESGYGGGYNSGYDMDDGREMETNTQAELSSAGQSSFGGTDPYSAAMAGYMLGFKDAKDQKRGPYGGRSAEPEGGFYDDSQYDMGSYPPKRGAPPSRGREGLGGGRSLASRVGAGAEGNYGGYNTSRLGGYNTSRGSGGGYGSNRAAGGYAGTSGTDYSTGNTGGYGGGAGGDYY